MEHNPIWPSLYANSMGKLFTFFGTKRIYIQFIQIAMWLTAALLFYKISFYLFPSRIAAYTSLALFLFSPELISFTHFLWPEIPHLFFFITALWLAICHFKNPIAVILCGVFFGLALLTKLLLLPFISIILVFLVFYTSSDWKQKFFKAFTVGSIIFITVLPTMLSNLQSHGKFMIADSSLVNIWIGLNDSGSDPYSDYRSVGYELLQFEQSGPDIRTRNNLYLNKIICKIKQQGIIYTIGKQLSKQYFRLFFHETFFTAQLPGGPIQAYSFNNPVIINFLHIYSHALYGFILAFSTMGMFFIRLRPVGWPHLFLLFILYNLGLFLFIHTKPRYIIQFMPMMMFFSGVTAYWVSQLLKGGPFAPISCFIFSRLRVALGIVSVLLIEIVAFRSLLVTLLG